MGHFSLATEVTHTITKYEFGCRLLTGWLLILTQAKTLEIDDNVIHTESKMAYNHSKFSISQNIPNIF